MKGRGLMPTFEMKSIATKSGDLAIAHSIWGLPSCLASAGNDLFSSLWSAVGGCLSATATVIRNDQEAGDTKQRERCIRLYAPFFLYLGQNEKSPLDASLLKLALKPDRWRHIAHWPFGFNESTTTELAEEAKKMARAHCSLAKSEARKSLDEKIEESLNQGGGWLHKFVKNEPVTSPHIKTGKGYITDPTEILQHHSESWSNQWKTGG